MIITCVICGKEIEAIKSTKKYCSDECARVARKNRLKKMPKEERNAGLVSERECPICGVFFRPKNGSANQRTCCYSCMPDGVQLTRGMFLAKIKEARGGQCIRCGYNTTIKALEFHHLDPNKKDFTISNDHFKLREAVEESKKCILLCANCHRELHDNLWSIKELE